MILTLQKYKYSRIAKVTDRNIFCFPNAWPLIRLRPIRIFAPTISKVKANTSQLKAIMC